MDENIRCTSCGTATTRADITVKRSQWATFGARYRVLRSRTTAWLCRACRDADPQWTQQPPTAFAPFFTADNSTHSDAASV